MEKVISKKAERRRNLVREEVLPSKEVKLKQVIY
jgi:hypothetical protein